LFYRSARPYILLKNLVDVQHHFIYVEVGIGLRDELNGNLGQI